MLIFRIFSLKVEPEDIVEFPKEGYKLYLTPKTRQDEAAWLKRIEEASTQACLRPIRRMSGAWGMMKLWRAVY